MAQPPKRRPKRAPEPLDWRELANGPALRGLSDVLATPAAVARERAERRLAMDQTQTPTVGETPTEGVSPATAETTTVGVFKQPPSPLQTPTEGGTPTVVDPPTVGATRVENAPQSMTLGEERFHRILWQDEAGAAVSESDTSKIFSLGYDRLARLAGLDEKSVRQLIPRLVAKQILEIVAPEDCSARQGKTYRIFAPGEILRRQRRAGLTHVVKRGRAVEFVAAAGGGQ